MKIFIIRKLPNKRAETVVAAFRDIEANTFCEFKTLTSDNGPEFALHEQITQITGAQVYFARPYHSWERGLNERTNGLGRKSHPRTAAALALILQGEALSSVTEKTGISRATYFRLKRKIKNDAKNASLSQ